MNSATLPDGCSPLSALDRALAARIRLVATDVDGTLTRGGALDPRVVEAIERLTAAGIAVWPVSGRPAGEVLGLCRYLPGVQRGIAENGLLEIVPDREPRWIGTPTDVARLREVGDTLNRAHDAKLRLAGDHFCRLGDVAYERDGREDGELRAMRPLAEAHGVHFVWSNVHVHLAERLPDKGEGLLSVLREQGFDPSTVLTIGDAPNDAGLFTPHRFGVTVGTADVLECAEDFSALPSFISEARESDAFLRMAERLLDARPVAP